MSVIRVKASTEYDIHIEAGSFGRLGELVRGVVPGAKAMVISDSNLSKIYGEKALSSLTENGYGSFIHTFPAGEENKNTDTLIPMIEGLAEKGFTREDVVIALGGGVTGDMAGLASALYMRGIGYVQVPTSLLAAVDSSVGGKTAVDLPQGKNLMGSFHQPSLVIIDRELMDTLPEREFRSGLAEVVKYAMIADPDIFNIIQRMCSDRGSVLSGTCAEDTGGYLEEIIERCIRVKAEIVRRDEFDRGERKLLNFGHTLGHGLEKLTDYRLRHGEAVAVGMTMITEASVRDGICEAETAAMLKGALKMSGLSVEIAAKDDESMDIRIGSGEDSQLSFTARKAELMEIIRMDKKSAGDSVSLILPERAGRCVIRDMSFEKLAEFI